jgi:nicotinate phosphoribosyltransferase
MAVFETVSDDTIKKGYCTDIYFVRTEETLRLAKINPVVSMEVTASALPDDWAVFCGLSDVIALLEGIPVTVAAMPEGSIFLKN